MLLVGLACSADCATAGECSTEKVNGDCTLTIDRSYPVAMPTIQMRRGAKMTVVVTNPLGFETLSLDPQSAGGPATSATPAAPGTGAYAGRARGCGEAECRLGQSRCRFPRSGRRSHGNLQQGR